MPAKLVVFTACLSILNEVLNSCEASDANYFSLSITFSIRSNKSLMFLESSNNSFLFLHKIILFFVDSKYCR